MEMNTFRKILIIVAILVFVSAAAYFGFILPLGARLKTTPPPATPLPTAVVVPTDTAEPAAASADTRQARVVLPTQAPGICGETGVLKVLLLGENLPETPRRGADAIRLMRVDYDQKRVDVLALPPDLWVQTPALEKAQIDATTLTLVYFEGKQITPGGERSKMKSATDYFAQTLVDNFSYLPTNYITLKQSIVRDLVDELGGLKINLPQDVDGRPEGFGYFSAGEQVLAGQQVVDYVRILNPANDPAPNEWKRLSRQNQVLSALNAQLTSPETITRIPGIAQKFYSSVITDLSVKQLFSLSCLLGEAGVTITISDLDPILVTPGEGGVLIPDTAEVSQFIQDKVGP
jgi:LCP family protein required for cell wall assembly